MARLRPRAQTRGGRYRTLGEDAGHELEYYAAWPDAPLPSRGQAALDRHAAYLAGRPFEVLPVEILELLPESQHPPTEEHEHGGVTRRVSVDDGRRFLLGPGDSWRPAMPRRAGPP